MTQTKDHQVNIKTYKKRTIRGSGNHEKTQRLTEQNVPHRNLKKEEIFTSKIESIIGFIDRN